MTTAKKTPTTKKPKRTNRKLAGVKTAKKPTIAQKSSKSDAPKRLKPAPAAPTPNLTGLEKAFVLEYSHDRNGVQAYLRVRPDCTYGAAGESASQLLKKPEIQAAIDQIYAARRQEITVNAKDVVLHAWDAMTADPGELVETRVGCCRHCWGFEHRFQRTNAKFRQERDAFELSKAMAPEETKAKMGEFDVLGGDGFDKRRPANPDCPECGGEGEPRIVVKDLRKASKGALALFGGVKVSKSGQVEVIVNGREGYNDKMMRHFGMYKDKLELTMPTVRIKDLTGRKDTPPEAPTPTVVKP